MLAVTAETVGSDRGMMQPMLGGLHDRYGRYPKRHLVDGGFNNNATTEWAAAEGVAVYGPPPRSKHRTDPYLPREDDGPGVAQEELPLIPVAWYRMNAAVSGHVDGFVMDPLERTWHLSKTRWAS